MKCPKCGEEYERLLALSRRDNKTQICDICAITEALEDFPHTDKELASGVIDAAKKGMMEHGN